MVNYFHCPECWIDSEIKTTNDEIFKEALYCPYCGYTEGREEDINEELYDVDDY